MPKPRWVTQIAFAGFLGLFTVSVLAQPQTGRIAGAVRNTLGTTVGGAPIVITNEETEARRIVQTSAMGTYEAIDLLPGLYTVSADVQGFVKVVQKGKRVVAGQTLTLDFVLELTTTENVTVTAMRRSETVFDTPISVTAVTEDKIQQLGIQDLQQVAANVANFEVQNLGPGQSTVAIRGLSSGQIARDQPGVKEQVGVYLDDSTLSLSLFTPDMDLFDVGRVEVLRGPQGTLFGAGNVGGTVRYITNQPQLGLNQTFGEVSGNTVDGGGQGGTFKAGFNAALGNGAAMRMAAFYNKLPGYVDAIQPDGTVNTDVNSSTRAGVRVAFDFAPIEGLTIVPRFVYQNVSADGWNRQDNYNILANPYTTTRPQVTFDKNQQYTQIGEPYSDIFTLGDFTIKYHLGDVLLTSVTAFSKRNILVTRDSGALTSSINGGSIGLPEAVYTLNAPLYDATTANAWTEEFRASYSKGSLDWVAGVFYMNADRHYSQKLVVQPFTAMTGIPTQGVYAPVNNLYWSDIQYRLNQWGIFGEATYSFSKMFSGTVGLRYYNYSEDKTLIFDGLYSDDFPKPELAPGNQKADGVAPRFIATFKPTDDVRIDAQAAKGFRLGGYNDPILARLCTDPADLVTFANSKTWQDETDWNYEIDGKFKLFGGRGSLNASAFYVDVSNLQVVVTAGTCSSRLVYNVPTARTVGGELEFTMAPSDQFDFSASVGYNDAKVTSTLNSSQATIEATGIQDGNRLPSTPTWQAALNATFQQPICYTWLGYINGNWSYIGSRYTQLADQEPGVGTINLLALKHTIGGPLTQNTFTFNPLLPAYNTLNMRLGVRHNVWDFAFYVNNLTNEYAYLALDRERGFLGRQGFLVNQPRTYGVQMRVDF